MDATSSSPSSTLHYPPGYPSAYIPHPTSTVVVDPHRFSLPPILNNTPVQLVLIFLLLITLALIAAGIYYALRVFRGSTGMSTEGHRNTLPTFATPFRRHPQSPMSSLSSPESLPSSPYLRTPPMDNYMYGVVIPQAAHTKYCGHVLDLRNESTSDNERGVSSAEHPQYAIFPVEGTFDVTSTPMYRFAHQQQSLDTSTVIARMALE